MRNRIHVSRPKKGCGCVLAIFLLVGIGLGGWGAYSAIENYNYKQTAHSIQGSVVELESRRSSEGGTVYYPVVRWYAPNGSFHEFTGNFGTSPSAYAVGEEVEVLYDPADYTTARLGGTFGLWGASAVLIFMGAVFFGLAAFAMTAPVRRRKRKAWLERYGRCVQADVVDSFEALPPNAQKLLKRFKKHADTVQWQQKSGYLCAVWKSARTRNEYMFQFTDLSPEEIAKAREDGHIDVLIDPKKPRHYMARVSAQ